MHLLAPAAMRSLYLTVSASVSSYNAFTAAGSPSGAYAVVVTIPTGVIVGGVTSGAAFRTGGWAAGSTFVLINQGRIEGYGGSEGQAGGDAVDLGMNASIDNRGVILAGGGGGAHGTDYGGGGGGGGGGGQGNPGGQGGAGSAAPSPGSAGGNGTRTTPGAGGVGGNAHGNLGGDGGGGGGWGQSGGPSGYDTGGNNSLSFGASGRAVRLNGHTVTWIAGFNTTQVKGTVA